MDKDTALRLALEALQFALHVGFDESSESQIKKGAKAGQQHRQAITAIKATLEAKDEPVACCNGYYKQGYEAGFSGQQHYIHALQEALAKQEQGEPVALKPCAYESKEKKMCRKCGQVHAEAIWDTTPPQRKPLTIDAIIELAQEVDWPAGAYIDFARAIESAHGIKEEA